MRAGDTALCREKARKQLRREKSKCLCGCHSACISLGWAWELTFFSKPADGPCLLNTLPIQPFSEGHASLPHTLARSLHCLHRLDAARGRSSGFKSTCSLCCSSALMFPACQLGETCLIPQALGGYSLQLPMLLCGFKAQPPLQSPCCCPGGLAGLHQRFRPGHHTAPPFTSGPHHTCAHGPQAASPEPLLGGCLAGLHRAHRGWVSLRAKTLWIFEGD